MSQITSGETDVIYHLQDTGATHSAEAALVYSAADQLASEGRTVTNSAIILFLIAEIESTFDPVQVDALISALKLVVHMTPGEEERWAFFNW